MCYSTCSSVASNSKFTGPQVLAHESRYLNDSREDAGKRRLNLIEDNYGIWSCHFDGLCSKFCPKGVDLALGIQLLRGHLMKFSKEGVRKAKLEVIHRDDYSTIDG